MRFGCSIGPIAKNFAEILAMDDRENEKSKP